MTVRNVRSLRFATVLLVNLKTVRAYCAVKPEHEKLVKDVSTRLLAVATSPKDYEWPPLFLVIDKEEVNAFAVSLPPKDKTKRVPGIGITGAMMEKVVNGDADLLAMLLA
ncbi:MAG: hypothetical protein HY318_02970, partial [Armatimonadetes bacterium]|nr:hypothetical protein [Armatimonadota bacterium]